MNNVEWLEDNEVVLAFRRGEKWTEEELYRRYFDRVFKTCQCYLKSVQDAEDTAQDVMCKIIVHRKLLGYRGDGVVWYWVRKVAINACLEIIRKQKRRQEVSLENQEGYFLLEETLLSKEKSPEEQLCQKESREESGKIIEKLTHKLKWAVYLTVVLDCSYKEAAKKMKISVDAVGVCRSRGLKQLFMMLKHKVRFGGGYARPDCKYVELTRECLK